MGLDRDTVLSAAKLFAASTATTVANRQISARVTKSPLPHRLQLAIWLAGIALGNFAAKRLAARP